MSNASNPSAGQAHGSSRRDFLKGSAGVIATATLANALMPSGVYAKGDDTLKIALIGCGGRGSGACDQALNTSPAGGVKLIAVADAFEDQARSALKNLSQQHKDAVDVKDDHIFVGFDAYEKALAAGPDVVILATPPGFRPIHFEAAVKAGKNIFMEKPVSTDAPGIRKVLAAAEEAKKKNLKVAVGLQRHHQAPYIDIIKRLQDGELGEIILTKAYWNGTRPWVRRRAELAARKEKEGKGPLTEMEYQMRNWYYFNWVCGDHINEQHIHNLDVINWLKNGHPVKAQGVGGKQVDVGPDSGEIYDHHMIEFTYPDGSVLLSECRHQPGTWQSVSEHAYGTKGYADISAHSMKFKDGTTWKSKAGGGNPYQVEHDDLFAAIRADKPYSEAEYGAHSTMTAIFGRMATYSGKEVHWDDALNKGFDIMPKKFSFDADPPTKPDKDGLYPIPTPGKTLAYEGQK
jgi:predicted dehydrogenase